VKKAPSLRNCFLILFVALGFFFFFTPPVSFSQEDAFEKTKSQKDAAKLSEQLEDAAAKKDYKKEILLAHELLKKYGNEKAICDDSEGEEYFCGTYGNRVANRLFDALTGLAASHADFFKEGLWLDRFAINENSAADFWMKLANEYLDDDQVKEALGIYQKVIRTYPVSYFDDDENSHGDFAFAAYDFVLKNDEVNNAPASVFTEVFRSIKATYDAQMNKAKEICEQSGGEFKEEEAYPRKALITEGLDFIWEMENENMPNKWKCWGRPYFSTTELMRDYIGDAHFFIYQGNPGAAFIDKEDQSGGKRAIGGAVKVLVDDGKDWSALGELNFEPDAERISTFVEKGVLYVAIAYCDRNQNEGGCPAHPPTYMTVMKLAGSSWIMVGSGLLSKEYIGNSSFAFCVSDGVPYVTCSTYTWNYNCDTGRERWEFLVSKYEQDKWVQLGGPVIDTSHEAGGISMSVVDGKPYVTFCDTDHPSSRNQPETSKSSNQPKAAVPVNDGKIQTRLMKYEGSNWVDVGPSIDSASVGMGKSFDVLEKIPYLAYVDLTNNSTLTVNKLDDGNWKSAGGTLNSSKNIRDVMLCESETAPYVIYGGGNYANNLWGSESTVLKLDAGSWVTVGDPGFVPKQSSLKFFSMESGKIYVGYVSENGLGVMYYK